jgi:hypothetical protein
MKKKLIWGVVGLLCAYYITGVVLLYCQVIQSFPIAPGGFRLKYGGGDQVGFGTEGPIVRYEAGGPVAYTINSRSGTLQPTRRAINTTDTLLCEAATDQFTVTLADSLPILPAETTVAPATPIVAVSDVEGDFEWFATFLKRNRLTDSRLNWAFGAGHLVLLGDYFDRGTEVLPCLWLIYRLEQQARAAGGQVHFILGNHDVMNMANSMHYVRKKYFINADSLRLPYAQWFDTRSELGRWLRTKHTAKRINGTLFCHAGIGPGTLAHGLPLSALNARVRMGLGLNREAIDRLTDPTLKQLLLKDGPLWYRGYFMAHDGYQQATPDHITAVLTLYKVDRIVVGHTIVEAIRPTYGGRVVGIDIERKAELGRNVPSALLIQNNQLFTLDEAGRRRPLPR